MKLFFRFSIFFLVLNFFAASCKKDSTPDPDAVTFTGCIYQQESITTYQYGTYSITNGTMGYALTSETIDLSQHIGDTVTIEGMKKEGYPVEDGPDYVEVTTVLQ